MRPVLDRLWADPPIASEGVTWPGTRSIWGTFLGPRARGFLQLRLHLHRGRGPSFRIRIPIPPPRASLARVFPTDPPRISGAEQYPGEPRLTSIDALTHRFIPASVPTSTRQAPWPQSHRSFPEEQTATVAREALGLVETRGWVGAVEAADAMCKSARVRLTRYEVTTDSLVTVIVRGSLGEVEAAVAAGVRSAERVGELVAHHVIPAPEPQLEDAILTARGGREAPSTETVL